MIIDLFAAKKRFVALSQVSLIFSRFLIISWYDYYFWFYYHLYNLFCTRSKYSIKIYTEPSGLLFWNISL